MASEQNGPEKMADISPKEILDHPELYERVVYWIDEIRSQFHIGYKKRKE